MATEINITEGKRSPTNLFTSLGNEVLETLFILGPALCDGTHTLYLAVLLSLTVRYINQYILLAIE